MSAKARYGAGSRGKKSPLVRFAPWKAYCRFGVVTLTPAKRAELSDGACSGWGRFLELSCEGPVGGGVGWERFSATSYGRWACFGVAVYGSREPRCAMLAVGCRHGNAPETRGRAVVYTRSRLKQWCQRVTAKSRARSLTQTLAHSTGLAEHGSTLSTGFVDNFEHVDVGVRMHV